MGSGKAIVNSKYINMLINLAKSVSEYATCRKIKVGAVICDKNARIISTGYNGTRSKFIECLELDVFLDYLYDILSDRDKIETIIDNVSTSYQKHLYKAQREEKSCGCAKQSRELLDFLIEGLMLDVMNSLNLEDITKEFVENKNINKFDKYSIESIFFRYSYPPYFNSLPPEERQNVYMSNLVINKILREMWSEELELLKEDKHLGDVYSRSEFKRKFNLIHSRFEFHAEQNAILRSEEDLKGKSIIITHSPCFECAKLIVLSGIDELVYLDDYNDIRFKDTTEEFLRFNGVRVHKLKKDNE